MISLELGVFLVLGRELLEPIPAALPDPTLDADGACADHAVVQPRHVCTINRAVRAWSQQFLREQQVGEQLTPVLASYADQFLVRYDLNRAHLLADPTTEVEVLEHLATQRVKFLSGVMQLLEPGLAMRYEQEFFATWDQAWLDQHASLAVAGASRADQPLVDRVSAPLGGQ